MKDDCVLVEIWIPAAYLRKDMYLPMDLPIHLVMGMLNIMLHNLGDDFYELYANAKLYRLETSMEIHATKTLREYGVMNTETLVIM